MSLPVPDNGRRAVRKSGWTALRFLLTGLVALLIAGLTFATASNVATLAHRERTEPVVLQRTGMARVDECVEHGPISRHGFGGWDSCVATVTWSDGSVETRRTERNFFQAAEIGLDVPVGEINVRQADSGYHPVLIRAEWPNDGSYIIAAIALCLIGALLLLGGVGYLLAAIVAAWSAWRRPARRHSVAAGQPMIEIDLDEPADPDHASADDAATPDPADRDPADDVLTPGGPTTPEHAGGPATSG